MSEINDILQFLTKILKNYSFKKIKILYGGSVNLSNIKEILSLQKIRWGFGRICFNKTFIY